MALVTPTGLQIRVDPRMGFSLISRLRVKDAHVDAVRVLRTCDAIEGIPGLMGFTAGLTTLFLFKPAWTVVVGILIGTAIGRLLIGVWMNLLGMLWIAEQWTFRFPFIVRQPMAWFLVWLTHGWFTVPFWAIGSFLSPLIELIWSSVGIFQRKAKLGIALSDVEVSFIDAYLYYARRLGVTTDTRVSNEEMDSAVWEDCFEEYAAKMPASAVQLVASDLQLALAHSSM